MKNFFIWDFDGTLFDTYSQIAEDLQAALHDLGVRISLKEVYALAKVSISSAVGRLSARYGLGGALLERYEEYARRPELPLIVPYPGAREACEKIVARGGRNCLYTHRGVSAMRLLERFDFARLFCGGVTKEDGFPRKPAPDAIVYLLRSFSARSAESVIIGDRDIDIDAGANAGIEGCLFDPDSYYPYVQTPYRARSMLEIEKLFLN